MSNLVYIVFVRLPSFETYPFAVFADRDEAEDYASKTNGGFVSAAIPFYLPKEECGL